MLVSISVSAFSAQEDKPAFFLPKNPVAAAYVLGRLSNQELIAAPRSEFVYVALLQRPGLERKYRQEALEGLAGLRHTDALTELLVAMAELDKKGEDAVSVLRDLSAILLQSKPAVLAAKRASLEQLVAQSQIPLTKQVANAALITADTSIEPRWKAAAKDPAQLAEVLGAIPLVRDPALRTSAVPRIEPLLHKSDSSELQRAAIAAVVSVPGYEAATFKVLADLAVAGTERAAAISALQALPQKTWPRESAEPLVNRLLEYLQSVPAAERTSSDFANALQFTSELASLLPTEKAQAVTKTLRGLGPTIVVLRAVYEQLRYDKTVFVVEASKPVALTLDNQDAMPHNIAILSPGALEEIGLAAEKMSAEPDAEGRLYIPVSPKVLHATKLAAPGQKVQLTFAAPAELGDYPYVCTFPGHWRRMTGTMLVVKDADAYFAAHPQSELPKLTEWKIADLAPEISNAASARNLQSGRALFTQLACVQCHKLGKEGYAFGPELTDVFTRYKGDRAAVLEQILDPSKIIDDRYRNFSFEMKDGEAVSGLVLREDAQTVTIQSGPSDSLIQTLKKPDAQKRTPQNSSLMPVGLLNSLSKAQIFDLLAYIEAGGKIEPHQHGR
jgi:putative heme-binding domain-containing protein